MQVELAARTRTVPKLVRKRRRALDRLHADPDADDCDFAKGVDARYWAVFWPEEIAREAKNRPALSRPSAEKEQAPQ
jgi:hypothetical protein